jgi:peptide-methionine (S)-S-oxide reductase
MGDHTESIQVEFDPNRISYERLLEIFWEEHDAQRSSLKRQYRSVIFYHNEQQRQAAEKSKADYEAKIKGTVRTTIEPFKMFYCAENYHQKFYLQKYSKVIEALGLEETEDYIASTVAAKLNGYVNGRGNPEDFKKELPTFDLPIDVENKIRRVVERKNFSYDTCKVR